MRTLLVIMLALLFSPTQLLAEQGKVPPKPQLSEAYIEGRVGSLERLLNSSSGAKRVDESGNAEAISLQEQARTALKSAEQALDASDLQQADQALSDATRLMFEAIRLIGTEAKQ